jgi:hypothetical protein
MITNKIINKYGCLLECYTVTFGRLWLIFQMCLLPPLSGYPGDGASKYLQNVCRYLPDCMMQHPRRQQYSYYRHMNLKSHKIMNWLTKRWMWGPCEDQESSSTQNQNKPHLITQTASLTTSTLLQLDAELPRRFVILRRLAFNCTARQTVPAS